MKVCIGFFQHTTPPMQFNIGRYSEREKLPSNFKFQNTKKGAAKNLRKNEYSEHKILPLFFKN